MNFFDMYENVKTREKSVATTQTEPKTKPEVKTEDESEVETENESEVETENENEENGG